MKKRIIPVIAIIFLTIGLYPKTEIYKDRGTKITKAMLYTYVDFNQLEDGCQESKLFFFPNNKGDYEDFYAQICPKSLQEKDKNNEENIGVEETNLDPIELLLLDEFADPLGIENPTMKTSVFRWNIDGNKHIMLEGWELEEITIMNPENDPINQIFDTWKPNFYMAADGAIASSMGYQKDNIVCKVDQRADVTDEELDSLYDLSNVGTLVKIACASLPNNQGNNENSSNEEYIAYGGEPFWDIVIKDGTLSFSSPEQYNEETDTIEPINYLVKTKKEGTYIHFLGEDISATFEKKDCISDGKGDVLPYTVTLLKDGDLEYNGCGNTK